MVAWWSEPVRRHWSEPTGEPIHGRERHRRVREDPVPFAERLVGGDQDGAAFIARADQFEERAGLGLVLGDVGEVIEVEAGPAGLPVEGPPADGR